MVILRITLFLQEHKSDIKEAYNIIRLNLVNLG